jgi:4-amino-4-deoxy-L-arabinose transferase-like glycosyltransferase
LSFVPASAGRAALLLVAFSSLLHLLAAGGGAGLSGDEAHYALYGYHLDWSYFDHPPLVGWLQALVLPFSSGEFALRLWPVLLGALASLALFRLTRELYPAASPWTAFVAVALLHSALAFQVLSLAMLPDTPLLPLGIAAALVLWRVLERGAACDWLWLGLLLGLAGLAKYTAVTLALSAVLLLALGGQWAQLRRPWPWLAVGLALLLITPWDRIEHVARHHYPWLRVLPVGWLLRDRYDSVANLAGYRGRVGVAIAGNDSIVPPALGRALFETLPEPKRLWIIAAADHNDWLGRVDAAWWRTVTGFLLEG